MRKAVKFVILFAFMVIIAGIFSVSVGAVGTDVPTQTVWNGTATTGFESGSGTEEDPFVIKTGEQLAYLTETVNEGNNYEGKYLKLSDDIMLNDESLSFDADTGLVRVSNGTNIGYLGTGIRGDRSGANTVFDTNGSKRGEWYVSNNGNSKGMYSGVINEWTGIGIFVGCNSSANKPFSGTFDGAGHTVSGIYINAGKNHQGLFGYSEGTIKNTGVIDSYICGDNNVGGVVGVGSASNCYNSGTVSGSGSGWSVGGVVGWNDEGTVRNCYNTGAVSSGGNYVGGVVGRNSAGKVQDCYNTGAVSGNDYVGRSGRKRFSLKLLQRRDGKKRNRRLCRRSCRKRFGI